MRRALIVLASTVAVGLSIVGPARAADDLAAWREGFPPASAIGASLGSYGESPQVTAEKFKGRWFVCSELRARPTTGLATANYATTPPTESGVRADARVYATPGAAKAAFTSITTGLKKCVGSRTVESEPGSKMTWVVNTSVGTVPSVTGDAKASLFVYERQKPAKGSTATQAELGSSYSVLTLVDNAILVSDATVAGAAGLSKAQRAAVASFAGDFVDTWVKANG